MLKQVLFIGILVSDTYQITVYAYTRTNAETIEMTAYRPDVCNITPSPDRFASAICATLLLPPVELSILS